MRKKVLTFQLMFLFIASIFSYLHFYFESSLPDNFLIISSSNNSINIFSYGLSSLLALFDYYVGTWVALPLTIFGLCYHFAFSKRDYFLDQLNFISIILSSALFCYLFFPMTLGEGILYLIQENIPLLYASIAFVAFFIIMFAGCFRSTFKEKLLGSYRSLVQLYKNSKKKVAITDLSKATSKMSPKKFIGNKTLEIQERLRGKSGMMKEQSLPVVKKKESVVQTQVTEGTSIEEKKKAVVKPVQKIRKPVTTTLNERELINCISTDKADRINVNPDESYFSSIIERIEDKLSEFNVDAKIIHILKGPVVDTFELDLGEGVRVARVTSLTQDLSLALQGAPIRMIYPMEGKTTVGIEVPRDPREVIYLEDILDTSEFKDNKHSLALAMGKNAFGEPYVVDLAKMPHMLVAGATGAGKSVFINTLLVSLLVKMPPERLKLILIDPKQLELALYRNLPHLVLPVVTDPSTASLSLLWAVEEMERRYTILSKLGVRSIDGFNQKIQTASAETLAKIAHLYEGMEDEGYELPYFVIIIDEFADLILTKNGKSIETNICKLAAKARACGIHLVIATQRPSVDVITGLIKANFPTRVSFRVTAGQDSRTILNSTGAENLLGKGDMLYKHGVEMRRLHSAYVDEEDIANLVDKISIEEPKFLEKALDFVENGGEVVDDFSFSGTGAIVSGGNNSDPLYREAVKVVVEHRAASASMLQRRLKVGYNRAANLIETMESNGVVGPQQGSKPRQVLVAEVDS